jgi:predicted transposase YbfD/YdcC
MEIKEEELKELGERLSELEDYRRPGGNLLHKVMDIVVIGFVTVLCGLKAEYELMEEFGRAKEEWFRGFLELPNGIPDKNTFARVFGHIKPEALKGALEDWLGLREKGEGTEVTIDGKTIKGSGRGGKGAAHIVSAFVAAGHLTLGQERTEEKSNEITAIPALLEKVDVKGSVVTIDAMGCQKAIAERIIKGKADYVLAVKENQPGLYEQIKEYFEWMDEGRDFDDEVGYYRSGAEKDHGRIERREVWVAGEVNWLYDRLEWKNLRSIVRFRGHRTLKDAATGVWGQETVFDRYYITSLHAPAKEMAALIRGHWAVENKLHWTLDMVYGEDADQKWKNHAPENANILRKLALACVLRHIPEKKKSIKRYMLDALLHDSFRSSLIS